jgi:SNF2 family DNA or RNA helicase
MDKAMEIAEMVIKEEEDRLVIFSQFKEALKEFERRFNRLGITNVRYDGDTNDATAQRAQLDFDGKTAPNHPKGTECNADCVNHPSNGRYTGFSGTCPGYQWQVILAHYKKGGVGLNLNGARQAIFLDREWNPGKEDQAMGRIDRIDNLRDSVIHTIHVSESIDAFMDQLIEEKSKMNAGFDSTYSDVMEQLKQALKDGDLM